MSTDSPNRKSTTFIRDGLAPDNGSCVETDVRWLLWTGTGIGKAAQLYTQFRPARLCPRARKALSSGGASPRGRALAGPEGAFLLPKTSTRDWSRGVGKQLDRHLTPFGACNRIAHGQLKVGNLIRSSFGTDSRCPPALRQAVSPPTITNVLNPFSRSRCATRALVASRAQVQ